MSNNPVNVEELGSGIGTKRAAAAIAFRDAVERRGIKTVGKHMEKIIDDCQAAWTAAVNVTATAEAAARKVNTKGAKLVIAAAFTTGLVATRDFAAIDLSGYKYIGFWIKSDIPVAANVLQLVLDETAACASPDETLNIPVLAAGVWRYIRVAVTGTGTTRDALISVGIIAASDPGAATLFIDDIRAGNEYLGVADEMQDKDARTVRPCAHNRPGQSRSRSGRNSPIWPVPRTSGRRQVSCKHERRSGTGRNEDLK
jgi:hypothetical protein